MSEARMDTGGFDPEEQSPKKEIRPGEIEIQVYSEASADHPETNEDSTFADPELGIFGLFDGMGGEAAGDYASRLASQQAQARLRYGINNEPPQTEVEARKLMADALELANTAVLEAAYNPARQGMGTTAVVGYFWKGDPKGWKLIVGKVGDSRLYRQRLYEFRQLTRDDFNVGTSDREEAAAIEQLMADAASWNQIPEELQALFATRNQITQCIGRKGVRYTILAFDLNPGDRFAVVSDGVSDNLTEREIGSTTVAYPNNLQTARELVDFSREQSVSNSWLDQFRGKFPGDFIRSLENIRAKPDDMTAMLVEPNIPKPKNALVSGLGRFAKSFGGKS